MENWNIYYMYTVCMYVCMYMSTYFILISNDLCGNFSIDFCVYEVHLNAPWRPADCQRSSRGQTYRHIYGDKWKQNAAGLGTVFIKWLSVQSISVAESLNEIYSPNGIYMPTFGAWPTLTQAYSVSYISCRNWTARILYLRLRSWRILLCKTNAWNFQ